MKPRGSSGFAWQYFTAVKGDDSEERAKCNICPNKTYNIKDGNTSGMRKHLQNRHPDIWKTEQQKELDHKETTIDAYQAIDQIYLRDEELQKKIGDKEFPVLGYKIEQPKKTRRHSASTEQMNKITSYAKFKLSDHRQLKFDFLMAIRLCRGNFPLSFVEDPANIDFYEAACPRMTLKSRNCFAQYKIPLVYQNIKRGVDHLLETDLTDVLQAAITTDAWTSRNNDSYISLTLTYIDRHFDLKNFVLKCTEFSTKHNAINIGKKVDEMVAETPGLANCDNIVCVSDAASNMIAGMKNSKVVTKHLVCVCHTLHNVVQHTFSAVPLVKEAFEKFKILSQHLHQSTVAQGILKRAVQQQQEDDTLTDDMREGYRKVIQSCKTRWNSEFEMIHSILGMQNAFESIRDDGGGGADGAKLAEKIPMDWDFNIIAEIAPALQQMTDLITYFSTENRPTIHMVISKLFAMFKTGIYKRPEDIDDFSPEAKKFLTILHQEMLHSFPAYGAREEAYCFANILHPAYKGGVIGLCREDKDFWINKLILEHENHKKFEARLAAGTTRSTSSESDDPLIPLLQEEEGSEPIIEKRSRIQEEWNVYKKGMIPQGYHSVNSFSDDPLGWWEEYKIQLPLMAELARQWLCIPVSSTASERTFSGSGLIVTKLRTRLQPERVEQMLFIRQNYDKVKHKIGKINLVSEDPDDQPPPPTVVDDEDLLPTGSQPGGSQPGGSQPAGSQPGGSQPGGSQGSVGSQQGSVSVSSIAPLGTVSLADMTEGERGKQIRREIAAGFQAKTKQDTITNFLKKREEAAQKRLVATYGSGDEDDDIQEITIPHDDSAIVATFGTKSTKTAAGGTQPGDAVGSQATASTSTLRFGGVPSVARVATVDQSVSASTGVPGVTKLPTPRKRFAAAATTTDSDSSSAGPTVTKKPKKPEGKGKGKGKNTMPPPGKTLDSSNISTDEDEDN